MNTVCKKVLKFADEIAADWYKALSLPDADRRIGNTRLYFKPDVTDGHAKLKKDFSWQALDQCYFCGRTFDDYDGEYDADGGENGIFVYAAKCGVCEDCARAEAERARQVFYPYIVRKYERRDGRKTVNTAMEVS